MLKFPSVSVNGMTVGDPNVGIVFFIITLYMSGNHTKITHMAKRPSSNRKVSGLNPGLVSFSHCWFKNVIIMIEEIFYWNFQLIP